MTAIPFQVRGRKHGARRGVFTLPKGSVETPVFMPIATRGAVRVAPFPLIRGLGASVILANTFHLLLRPGVERLRRAGGLHTFLGWERPILTDSGGFQVMSLASHRQITDAGVRFRSPVDGSELLLTPETAVSAQCAFGSDISMVLDEMCRLPSSADVLAQAVRRTSAWAARGKDAFLREGGAGAPVRPLLFGIVQGGTDAALRRASAASLVNMGFDGYAIGGLAVGESQEEMLATLEVTLPHLPADLPRYLMVVGQPEDLVEAIRRGVDLFDCVLPTRNARHGLVYDVLETDYLRALLAAPLQERVVPAQLYRKLHIMNAEFAEDLTLLNPACPLLAGVRRAYLRHLFHVDPPVAHVLATIQNVWFFLNLLMVIRREIAEA